MLPSTIGGAATPAQPAPSETPHIQAFLGGSAAPPPADATPPEEPKAAEGAAPAAEAESPLAKSIREAREQRAARQAKQVEETGIKKQVEELRAENEKLKKVDDPISDPVGWIRARGMTKEQQLFLGQALLYDLAPDKAPPDLRQKMFEAKMQRERALEKEQTERQTQEQAQRQAQEQYQGFVASVEDAVTTFREGSYPESEAWFDGDADTYIGELIGTARRLADVATRAGQMADLSPAALAKELEADIARRIARRDGRRQQGVSKQEPAKTGSGQQPAFVDTTSTRGLGAGAPRPPAMTEAERMARASEALFRNR